MFKKPIRIKSNTQTKASERKLFKDLLMKTFSTLCEDEINNFIPKKESVNSLKISTSDNVIIQVYTVQKRPIIFELRGRIFPTVFLLWQFPQLVYCFTTHQQVMSYISSGADLMLPGVVTPPSHTGLSKYGNVSENDIVCVNLSNNRAAIAVGVASESSKAMELANCKGKCVNIYHFYGDHLCTLEGISLPQPPDLGAPEWLTFVDDDFPELDKKTRILNGKVDYVNSDTKDEVTKDINMVLDELNINENKIDINLEEVDDVKTMDELLMYCFLGAIKYSKSLTLPALI